jgi:hypothetical protein
MSEYAKSMEQRAKSLFQVVPDGSILFHKKEQGVVSG